MSNYLALAVGIDDYKEIIDTNKMYVDKTLLIKEFWEDGSSVILATRPRRFGKTLNLSMLKYFFEKTDQNTSYLFEKMKIWHYSEYQSLQAQFPVISVTFKDVKFDSWESAYEKFASVIAAECKRLLHCLSIKKISVYDVDIFNRLMNKQAPEHELVESLQFLSRLLCEQTGKKVIVLIDEYDAPITHAYLKGYYSKMVGFVGNLLSTVLKSNVALGRGFLTGIMRTAKEGIFSGLNNLVVNTVLDAHYSDFFGFTQEEVDQLLMHYDLVDKKEEIKQWYDGYAFGKTHVYNPWSLLNCINNRGIFDTYWANTSNNDLIKDIIARSNKEVKDDLELLLQGQIISERQIDKGIIYPDLDNDEQEPWSFLLFTGYLTATAHTIINGRFFYALAIPNKEIELLYQDLVLKVLNPTISFSKLKKLVEELVTLSDKWIWFLKNANTADSVPDNLQNAAIQDAFHVLNKSTWSQQNLELYDRSLDVIRSEKGRIEYAHEEGEAKGLARGLAEGRLEEKIIIAKQLLDILDVETIAKKINLDIEIVKKLKSES